MPIRSKTGFFIFLDDFSRLHRSEYNSYNIFTDDASKAWCNLGNNSKEKYNDMARFQSELYKIEMKNKYDHWQFITHYF